LCWLLNEQGLVVDWDWATMNTHDQHFHPLSEGLHDKSIVLADLGFRCAAGIPDNLKLCEKGTCNERMCVESALSMVTVVCVLKHIHHRLRPYIQGRLAICADLSDSLPPAAAGEEKEKLGPLHTVPQTAFPRPRQGISLP